MNAFYKEEEFNNEFYLMPDPPENPEKPGTGNDGDSEEEKS